MDTFTLDDVGPVTSISSVTIMLHSTIPSISPLAPSEVSDDSVSMNMTSLASNTVVNWICVDDKCRYFLAWSRSINCGGLDWSLHYVFHSTDTAAIFHTLFPKHKIAVTSAIASMLQHIFFVGMDVLFIPYHG